MTTALALRRRAMGKKGGPITDSFNRADSTTTLGNADTGEAWSTLRGTLGIINNTAYVSGVHASGREKSVHDISAVDHKVVVTMTVIGTGGNGAVVRLVSDVTYYYAEFSATTISLYSIVDDVATLIGNVGTVNANGDILTLQASGTTITVRKNGVEVISVTSSTITTGTKGGIMSGASSTTTRWDDFSLTAL